MKGQVIIFENAQFGLIRTIQGASNQPLFCLADLCKALDLGNPSQVKQRLREDGVITNEVIDSMKRVQQLNFVDEPNMYRCIFQSRKKEAELFQDWIFDEVLPSIRKTGRYEVKRRGKLLPRAKSETMALFYDELTQWVTTEDEKTVAELMNVTSHHVHEVLRGRCQSYGVMCMLVECGKENRKKGVKRVLRIRRRAEDMEQLRLEFMNDLSVEG